MGVSRPRPPVTPRTARARDLRSRATDAERALWRALRQRRFDGCKFRRQQPLGPYIVDFFCLERRLVVEVDGAHHAEQRDYDDARDTWLRSRRFRVIRFSDREVLTALESVEQAVWVALAEEPPPPPSPIKGEGADTRGGANPLAAPRKPSHA